MQEQNAAKIVVAEIITLGAYGTGVWIGTGANLFTALLARVSTAYIAAGPDRGSLLLFALQMSLLILTLIPAYGIGRKATVYGILLAAVGGFLLPLSTPFSLLLLLAGGALAAIGPGFRESYDRRSNLVKP